ncbi:hypothetical protein ASPWEDRAFT_168033 [Aspergillus wentii DTO 134E9]|uniref:Uncharacterized protein n=1 Tax=Aspergillus wentii DTO 134E9 TaxID=1073089 RepID=A0A1L9RT49_ASPWE|nr:uncharacterized protein ASPWEDRAFT_168033 [Aspergillus wentii DTO 134E9]OJJ38100.1 hypothetical protein ASPWEDRAFT_168033 [Aspergillus wentii DTO 134E9]
MTFHGVNAHRFYTYAQQQNQNYLRSFPSVNGASTHQGDISYAPPSLHPGF